MTALLRDGLIITVVGMGLVFGALALLWGLMSGMHRLFPPGRDLFATIGRRGRASDASPPHPPAVSVAATEAGADPTPAELAAVVTALALWKEERAAEQAIGWRLPPRLTRWLAVGRSRQVRSWTPRR
jgi:Na+-transporting methylmalonyl-CoA/oxaloacetate decarboxylase gamma subunit